MYVIGKTGTGKTTLLENMALQDIHAGRGIGIIDPHGEFVERVLAQVPSHRINDVVYFNPVDADYPMGFNVLEVPDPQYKHLVVSDLLGIFTKIWANVWSSRMEYILQNCIMALLDTTGTTLLGISRILVDKDYRQKIVSNIKDPVVRSFWVHEYETWREQFRNEAIVPIQNKVNQFLNTSFIRNIVGQPKSTLNIPQIMNEGKILLVNVSKGRIGEDNSQLLGAMIITKVQLAAMERVRISEEERQDFYLYVDEFQNFATDSFAAILSEARKYRLNLVIAHQYTGQLVTDVSTRVRDAVFGNVGTMICFRVGAIDAEFLENEFSPEFMQQDLINQPNHHIYLKLMVDNVASRPFSAATLPPIAYEKDPDAFQKIVAVSRERYANPREEVEARIAQWSGLDGGDDGTSGVSRGGTDAGKLHETQCSNCGKTATVPFKPDGRRPVYCQTCLKQIEEGKLIPLPERMPQERPKRFEDSLGDIGIEFSQQKEGEERRQERSRERKSEEKQERFTPDRGMGERRFPGSRQMPLQSIGGERKFFRERHDAGKQFPDKRQERRPKFSGQERSLRERGTFSDDQKRREKNTIQSEVVVRNASGEKSLSLSELKIKENQSKDEEKKSLKKPDIRGLRDVLTTVLEEKESQKRSKNAEPAKELEPQTEQKEKGEKEKNRAIKPGETVLF